MDFQNKDFWKKFQTYLVYDRKLSEKPAAMYAVKSRFNKLRFFFAARNFNRENFNLFLAELKSQNLTNAYMNKFIALAKHAARFMELDILRDYSYFHESRVPPKDILTPAEIKSLSEIKINYARRSEWTNKRQKLLIILMGTTGCRVGEALGLTFDDVFSTPPHILFKDTKNGDARQVPIGEDIYRMMMELRKDGQKIFVSIRNGVLNSQEVNIDLKKRAAACGIKKKVFPHLLRHSYITTMLELGIDWLDLSVIVGHRDPKTTLRYKQSLIGHYADIIIRHPLLKHAMTFEMVQKQLKKQIFEIVDTQKFKLRIQENRDSFMLKIDAF